MTTKDIAEICGVSAATVSRVINQSGRFSTETERRVREAIKKYNYQPNLLAKGLRQQRSDAIGVIVPSIANEFFSSMILAMQMVFFEAGYSINIYNTNNSLEIERQCHVQLAAQSVSGVISINSREDIRNALKRMIPTVYIDRFVEESVGDNVACISSDNDRSGALAARELWESGCRNPVVITASASSPITVMRSRGFVRQMGEYGIRLNEERIVSPEQVTFEEGIKQVERLITSGVEFDGIFCQTDLLAIGALEALRAYHISVPDEVAVVGHDDIMISRFGRPPLTTIHQDARQIGERAAQIMLTMTSGKALESTRITVPVGLVRRESTRHWV